MGYRKLDYRTFRESVEDNEVFDFFVLTTIGRSSKQIRKTEDGKLYLENQIDDSFAIYQTFEELYANERNIRTAVDSGALYAYE